MRAPSVPGEAGTPKKPMKNPTRLARSLLTTMLLTWLSVSISTTKADVEVEAVQVTPDSSVQVRWKGQTGLVYRVEYTPQLSSSTIWKPITEELPSQGTNSLWLDAGEFWRGVDHPRGQTNRFYRIVATDSNAISPPTVTITSPTNASVLSGNIQVSVIATSSFPVVYHRLFVDGQEMDPSEDGTNYFINTTEWPNGSHVLFATAKAQSGLETTVNPDVDRAWAVSPHVTVTFSNFISQWQFSQPFFEPELNQTQRITAVLEAQADWTLEILDAASNVVRSATGSGTSVQFDWDGTGTGNQALPNGAYGFALSAAPLSGPTQSAAAPNRPPSSKVVKGSVGTFGVIYNTYERVPADYGWPDPPNGLFGEVSLDGLPTGTDGSLARVSYNRSIAQGFAQGLMRRGWRQGFLKGDDEFSIEDIHGEHVGGNNLLNSVNLGLILAHGAYGTSTDHTPAAGGLSGSLQTYFGVYQTNTSEGTWVRLSDLNLGGSSTNGLRWLGILACSSLPFDQWLSMWQQLVLPINDDMHLLLGGATTIYFVPDFGEKLARQMLGLGMFTTQKTVDARGILPGVIHTGCTRPTKFL